MTGCSLCDLPTPAPPVTDRDVAGAFCCRGCLEVARTLDDPASFDGEDPGVALAEAEAEVPTTDREVPDDAETAYLSVDGMHCAACEAYLESVATREEGVHEAAVSYATDTARVVYDPGTLDEDDVPDVVSTLGYSARADDESANSGADADTADGDRVVVGSLAGMAVMLGYGAVLYPSSLDLPPTLALAVLVATLVLGMLYTGVALFLFAGAVRAAGVMLALKGLAVGVILGIGQLTPALVAPVVGVLATVVVGYTGAPFLRGAYVSVRASQPNMDLLVALAVLAAYGYSVVVLLAGGTEVYFDVAVMVVLVVTLGNSLEARAKRRATRGLSAFADGRVADARRRRADGTTETVPVEDLAAGEEVLVDGGDRIPVDGRVVEGSAAVDEALLTGEAVPDTKEPGDEVVGGTVLTEGRLVVAVGEDADSTFDRLLDLLWDVRTGRPGVQQFADRLAAVFVPLVVLLAAATAGAHLHAGAPAGRAVLTGVAVLVVSCPCALGLATPLAVTRGVGAALEAGVVVTDGSLFERVADVSVVVVDKTGTLTTGEMAVGEVATGPADRDDVLAIAAAVERYSGHPVAEAITGHADPAAGDVSDFEEHARGVAASVGDRDVRVGHPDLFGGGDWTDPDDLLGTARAEEGAVPVVVGWDGVVRGVVRVADDPRPEWRSAVAALAGPDRSVVVLTGDRSASADPFRAHPDVDAVFAGVPPEGKAGTVERLRARGTVAMVGDGSNDAPALAAADLGVAMASGTELAADAADAVVTDGALAAVPRLFAVGSGTRSRVRQNLGWALTYNAVAVPLAATGALNPLLAAVAMAASSLLVVANSARDLDGEAVPASPASTARPAADVSATPE